MAIGSEGVSEVAPLPREQTSLSAPLSPTILHLIVHLIDSSSMSENALFNFICNNRFNGLVEYVE
jgi:hypothetical protein